MLCGCRSPSYWVGLDNHAVFDGLVARIVPTEHPAPRSLFDGDINEPLYSQIAYRVAPTLEQNPYPGMILNSYRDPESNRSGLDEEYGTTTYFELYARLANHYMNLNQMDEARRALDTLSARMPPALVDWDYNLLQATGQLFQACGDTANGLRYFKYAAKKLSETPVDESTAGSEQYLQTVFRKGDLYMNAEMYDSARAIFSQLRSQTEGGNQLFVDFRLAEIDAKVLEQKGQWQKALDKLNQILTQYAKIGQMGASQELDAVKHDRDKIAKQLGVAIDTTPPPSAAPQFTVTPVPQPSGAPPPGAPQSAQHGAPPGVKIVPAAPKQK